MQSLKIKFRSNSSAWIDTIRSKGKIRKPIGVWPVSHLIFLGFVLIYLKCCLNVWIDTMFDLNIGVSINFLVSQIIVSNFYFSFITIFGEVRGAKCFVLCRPLLVFLSFRNGLFFYLRLIFTPLPSSKF